LSKAFLTGLHASPFQGFFRGVSEHPQIRRRRRSQGPRLERLRQDPIANYIKKFEAETNLTGYPGHGPQAPRWPTTYRQELTKFDYAICLAAALGYLMIHQQDPVGLVTFDTKIQTCLPPRSKAHAVGHHAGSAGEPEAGGQYRPFANCLHQLAAMIPQQEPGAAVQRPAHRSAAGAGEPASPAAIAATR